MGASQNLEAWVVPTEISSTEFGQASSARCWMWVLFFSPFPVDLVQIHPAIVLKYWKSVCGVLSTPPLTGFRKGYAEGQIACLVRAICKFTKVLDASLTTNLQKEDEERAITCLFAALVPAVISLCTVHAATGGTVYNPARAAFRRVDQTFVKAWQHPSGKVVQVAISSAQNLLQHPACTMLCPLIIPSLVLLLTSPALESIAVHVWGAMSAMIAVQQPGVLVESTTSMILQLVLGFAKCSLQRSDSANTAMAQCLVQVGNVDQVGLKAGVSAMSPEDQQVVQQLLRDHVSAERRGNQEVTGTKGPSKSLAATKIELKMKF